ncbi:MAG TPA: HAMP domain-containing sensor histidine kinase [Fibrobacteria bacterium]|nr:HAMP domain-containing sensor histidine kinase [Fibrobacteria bacterium]HOX53023.1 HAMP domain-containing sensor histidine kinase [Fibrobacteria bacterium]
MTARERWIPVVAALVGPALFVGLGINEALDTSDRLERDLSRRSRQELERSRERIQGFGEAIADTLQKILDPARLEEIRLGLVHPLVLTVYETSDGMLADPPPGGLSQEQAAFRERVSRLFSGRAVVAESRLPTSEGVADPLPQWIPWHWEDGLHILFQRPLDGHRAIGVELDRIALLSRLAGELDMGDVGGGSLALLDGSGRTLHVWGAESDSTMATMGRIALAAPFETWSLELSGPQALWARDARVDSFRSIFLRWGLASLVWIALGYLVGREWTRTLREARSKTGFVQQVSHELRTPLTNIRLHAELAREGTLEDDTFRHLEVVGQETERLSRLVGNILTFARTERGNLVLSICRTDLSAELREAALPFKPMLERAGTVLEWSVPPGDLPASLDRDASSQVLQNLLGNALKYAPSGKWVGISVEAAPGFWQVRVRDRGPGVPERERERIFKPFHRLSNQITDGVAGTGIGLSIARDLARAQGGDLVLESGTGGCTFLWTVARLP